MVGRDLSTLMEDHALERVPDDVRQNWLRIAWNTTGLVTTLVIMFFGAVVCFMVGVKIALLAGVVSFAIGSALGWGLARITYETGFSNTLITRRYGLGVRGSSLASVIFGFLIVGFLAVENGLLYRGFLFFFEADDTWTARILIYGLMSIAWIGLTAFGFALVTRTSSLMLIGFLLVLGWMVAVVLGDSGSSVTEAVWFGSQMEPAALAGMGLTTDGAKFAFALNILVGPACALGLNTADFGRYGKSTGDVAAAAMIAIFVQSLLMMLVGGVLMKSAAPIMIDHFAGTAGLDAEEARRQVLESPDSIAATFMVFGGIIGFALMILAQAKAQVLNTYSSSLCMANFFDALFKWRPGRVTFVVLANVIGLALHYGQILEFVEQWIRVMGVLLAALAGTIIMDYYVVSKRVADDPAAPADVNWAGVISILVAVYLAHWLLAPFLRVEVLTSLACVALLYPALRLTLFRPGRSIAAEPPR